MIPSWVAGMMFCICSTLLLRLWLWRLFPPRSLLVMHSALWMPREKSSKRLIARTIRDFMGLSPSAYRKMISRLTSVVENPDVCWNRDGINYSHVPSRLCVFTRELSSVTSQAWATYLEGLATGTEKVNAAAIILTRFLLLILLNPLTLSCLRQQSER